LLENYLVFMLMCRGHKFFQLQDLSDQRLTEGQFKAKVKEAQDELEQLKTDGKATYIEVKRYPRAKHRLMYIFEGLKDKEDPTFVIPVHFFQFQDFQPELMRLKNENYFQYYERSKDSKKKIQEHVDAEAWRYKHYLAYDALLHNLEINHIIDVEVNARIEAHYTFLGKFLHPTKDAARDLHENNNWSSRRTGIGIEQQYADEAGTQDLRTATALIPERFDYFWFLFNDPPLYDRFNYCIHHATPDKVNVWGGYENVPTDLVSFNKHIYRNFGYALKSQSTNLYRYQSPLSGM
jgi:hypothetical protein